MKIAIAYQGCRKILDIVGARQTGSRTRGRGVMDGVVTEIFVDRWHQTWELETSNGGNVLYRLFDTTEA